MNSLDLIIKYQDIKFVNEKDKKDFLDFVYQVSSSNISKKDLIDFFDLIDQNFLVYTDFDKSILYNPISLLDAIFDRDLSWKKIDIDEIEELKKDLKIFLEHKNWWDIYIKKQFLEEKYDIEIILLEEDSFSISSWINWKKLTNVQKYLTIKYLYRLLNFYPINFIKNIKLQSIIVCSYFYKIDQYQTTMLLWWFETQSDNNIYLSFKDMVDSFDHELYHQAMQYYDDFSSWRDLRKNQNLSYTYNEIDKKINWFARNYWKENVSEDQATIAEEVIKNYSFLQKRLDNDNILNKKVNLVKKAYFDLSNWIMNDEYFEINIR